MSTPGAPSSDAPPQGRDATTVGLYLYSRVAATLMSLLALILAPRLYGQDGFAYVAGILLLYDTALALGSLGLADAVFYFVGRTPARGWAVVRQASFLLTLVAIPVIAAVWGGAILLAGRDSDLAAAMPWLAVVLLIELPTQPAVNQLLAGGQAKMASWVFFGFSFLRTAVLVVPGFVPDLAVTEIPMWMAGVALLRLALHVVLVERYYPTPPGAQHWLHRRELGAMLRFAAPAGVAAMLNRIGQQIDKYVVWFVIGELAFAQIVVAAHELPLINLIPYAIGAVLQVRYVRLYAENDSEGLRGLWHGTIAKTALVVLPLSMMFIVVADDLVVVAFGPDYAAAAAPFRLFTAVLLMRVAAYGPMLQATGQTPFMLRNAATMVGINLVLSVPLTFALGAPGAPLATLIAAFAAWLHGLRRIGGAMGGGIAIAMPWRVYARIMALATATAVVVWPAIASLPLPPAGRLPAGCLLYLVTYIVVGRVLGIIGPADLASARRWLSLRGLG